MSMQPAGSRALIVLFAIALTASSFTFASAQSTDPCPGSGHISTGEGADAAYPKGSKVCGSDEKKLFGGCDSDPYAYLEQRHRGDKSNSFITPRGGSQNSAQYGLNPGLACRLKKFMEFAETKGCPLVINSAMRPVQKCNPSGGACAPQGQSCHQYGLAVDVGGSAQCLNWVLATLGRKNASSPFGIHSAYAEHAGYRHLQCVENLQAACSPQTKGCGGDFNITPDTSGIPGPGTPTGGLANQFRQAMGMQPQQPSIPTSNVTPPPSPITSNLPQPTQSQFCLPEYKCSGNTLLYQNSFCATQISQTCSAGCQNGACIAATSSTSTTNTNTNTNTNEPATSTIDLISSIGGVTGATSTSVGTATPLQLILGLTQNQTTATGQSTNPAATLLATGSIASLQIVGAQQTFTSPDLGGIGVPVPQNQNSSALFTILENMKKVLLWALEYLKPFQVSRIRAGEGNPEYIE